MGWLRKICVYLGETTSLTEEKNSKPADPGISPWWPSAIKRNLRFRGMIPPKRDPQATGKTGRTALSSSFSRRSLAIRQRQPVHARKNHIYVGLESPSGWLVLDAHEPSSELESNQLSSPFAASMRSSSQE